MNNTVSKPSIIHAEPVLAVADVSATVNYYHEILGFPDKWTWGEPPNHGGVSWNGGAFLQFSLDAAIAQRVKGESVWLNVKEVEKLYESHRKNKADIVIALVQRPWGFMEYTVRDVNGYYVTFAERATVQRTKGQFPSSIVITSKSPTVDQLRQLAESVGWQPSTNAAMIQQINTAVYTVVAEDNDSGEMIGCGFLMGDHRSFYYVKDVIVHPAWQHKQIGTALMQHIMRWLEVYGAESATVGLFTGDHLASFYRQFGFTQACGMYTSVKRRIVT
ncbi:MAG TPA: GNAT family N-acetyltransferase [Chryseosolibacter sp.]